MLKLFISLSLVVLVLQVEVKSQTVDSIHHDWIVYEYQEDTNNKKCYIISFPKNSISNHTAIRNPFIMITRFAYSRKEEVVVNADYELKLNGRVYFLVDNHKLLNLFVRDSMAWFSNMEEDKKAIQQMLTGDFLKIRSDSAFATYAIDEYSLKGMIRAYNRMKVLCE